MFLSTHKKKLKITIFVISLDSIELISDIPIIPTFSYVTKIAFEACLQLSAIKTAVEAADEIMGGKVKAAHTWLQKFECLSQFLNEPNNIENSQIIQVLIASMRPLKVVFSLDSIVSPSNRFNFHFISS